MKSILAGIAFTLCALPGLADVIRVESTMPVTETADALQAAIEGAGARVFARVNHGAGAESVGKDIGASELLVFGNPAIGTPAMEADRLAGLYLPLKVLVYEADNKVWLAYEDPKTLFDGLEIPQDAEFIGKMNGALQKLTSAAASQ